MAARSGRDLPGRREAGRTFWLGKGTAWARCGWKRKPPETTRGASATGSWTGAWAAVARSAGRSIPVATTETRIRPCSELSKVEPKMMLASESTSSRIRLAAASTS